MNRLFSVFLISGLMLQLFSSQFYYAGFVLNQKYISTELCEKKEIVSNTCQGKCHLKKQITRSEEQKEGKDFPVKKGVELLFFAGNSDNQVQVFKENNSILISNKKFLTINGYPSEIFHPPLGFFS